MATSIDLDMGEVSRNKKRTMWKGIFMKRRRRMNELAMAAAVAMMVSGFNMGAMAAEALAAEQISISECVEKVTAVTYVGDDGEMTESYVVTVDDAAAIEGLTKDQITAVMEQTNRETKEVTEVPVEIKDILVDGATLTIELTSPVSSNAVVNVNAGEKYDLTFTSETAERENFSIADFQALSFMGSNGTEILYRMRSGSGEKQPLVLWMHGSGECGTDNRIHITANRGATAFAEYTDDASVIAAQYPESYHTPFEEGEEKIMEDWLAAYTELIQSLIEEGKVDADRVYLTGASMGGGLVLRYMTDYPELFARVVAMCSRGTINEDLSVLEAVADKPIWLFHAESDFVNPSVNSKEVYEKLVELGNKDAKLTIFSDEDLEKLGVGFSHAIWAPVLNDMEMMEWLFEA